MLKRQQVCGRQVRDVDIVADRRPVRCVIVVSENGDAGDPPLGGRQYKRDKMGLRIVMLAVRRGSSGCVEISESYKLKSVCVVIRFERTLDHEFCPAVRVRGRLRMPFVDRRILRLAVGCTRRGKDELLHSTLNQNIKQPQRLNVVVFEILSRFLDRLADVCVGREMHARIDHILIEYLTHKGLITDIPLIQPN